MDITVKVEYNRIYTGGPTSLEANLQFNFVQAESKEVDEGEVISDCYNCTVSTTTSQKNINYQRKFNTNS